eukprot:5279551-Pleurochrysis_carterae.AAC.2
MLMLVVAQADLERRHIDLIKAYGADLRDVQDTFAKQRAVSAPGACADGARATPARQHARMHAPSRRARFMRACVFA